MLRLASTTARGLLLLVGVAMGVWLPLSFYCWTYIEWEYSAGCNSLLVVSSEGAIEVAAWDSSAGLLFENGAGLRSGRASLSYVGVHRALLPVLPHGDEWVSTVFSIPFWLPTAMCLAWPVASFLARRRGRGFAVEVEAPVSTPLPPGSGGRAAKRSGRRGRRGKDEG